MKLTIWDKFKMDAKERFLNYEAAKGVFFIGAGALTMYVSVFHQQYVIQVLGLTWGWYNLCEGLRKLFVNRIKQSMKQEQLIQKRMELTNVESTN